MVKSNDIKTGELPTTSASTRQTKHTDQNQIQTNKCWGPIADKALVMTNIMGKKRAILLMGDKFRTYSTAASFYKRSDTNCLMSASDIPKHTSTYMLFCLHFLCPAFFSLLAITSSPPSLVSWSAPTSQSNCTSLNPLTMTLNSHPCFPLYSPPTSFSPFSSASSFFPSPCGPY